MRALRLADERSLVCRCLTNEGWEVCFNDILTSFFCQWCMKCVKYEIDCICQMLSRCCGFHFLLYLRRRLRLHHQSLTSTCSCLLVLRGNLVEIKTGTLDGCKTWFPSLEAYETPALSSCPCRLL